MNKPTALVTGASSGIGLEIAKELARKGYDLVLVARREEKLRELAALLSPYVEVTAIPLDLTRDEAPRQLFEALKDQRIEMVVNNAGFAEYGFFQNADIENTSAMMHLNIIALTQITRYFLPPMLERGSGRIMNVGSVAGFFPGPLMAVYYASKAFVLSFSEALCNEVNGSGVTVTCLCPGATRSEFQAVAGMQNSKLDSVMYMTASRVAKRGVKAMLRGDRVCVPGLSNRFFVLVPRLVPRGALAGIIRHIQERIPRD